MNELRSKFPDFDRTAQDVTMYCREEHKATNEQLISFRATEFETEGLKYCMIAALEDRRIQFARYLVSLTQLLSEPE